MGNKDRYTAQELIDAIKDSGGIKTAIAKRLGCHRHTVDNYIERYATVRRAYEAERESIIDLAESKFVAKINEGFWPAIRLALLTLGRERGFVERRELEHTGAEGGPIEISQVHEVRSSLESKLREAVDAQPEEGVSGEPE